MMPSGGALMVRWTLLWMDDQRAYTVFGMESSSSEKQTVHGGTIEFGREWPDGYPNEIDRRNVGSFLRFFAFLNSKCTESVTHRIPRAMIRRGLRSDSPFNHADEQVHVINLRAVDAPDHNGSSEEQRTYRNRFWVRGHIRAQWYPSLKGHRLIYVSPFVKGPADAPFAAQIYDVCR